jgi:hypothetical protein
MGLLRFRVLVLTCFLHEILGFRILVVICFPHGTLVFRVLLLTRENLVTFFVLLQDENNETNKPQSQLSRELN